MTCHFIIYNVKLGQCIGVLPDNNHEYATMIDCGHDDNFHPINDFGSYIHSANHYSSKPSIRLLLTNYDHDHFSGLPYLNKSAHIKSVLFPKNLSMKEIRELKSESTQALDTLEDIRSRYTDDVTNYTPPFTREVISLHQDDLKKAGIKIETNHLSQMVFIKYGETTFCVPGDLERPSWDLMLAKAEVQHWLARTNILIASHHGRENGYHQGIFDHCKPECIILSDKHIQHNTQKDMTAIYANHVFGDGIAYKPNSGNPILRRTLTTRNDGHILVEVPATGRPKYRAHTVS